MKKPPFLQVVAIDRQLLLLLFTMGVMQNNLLLGNITVAAGYVPVARDVSAIRTSAVENSFTGSSFKEDIPATITRKRMPNIRFIENRLLATKSYPQQPKLTSFCISAIACAGSPSSSRLFLRMVRWRDG